MADNKVKFLRGTSNEYAVAEKDSDTIYFTTDDGKLYIGDKEISGTGSLTIDDTLSDTSTNPVQNKVVKQAIDNKADKTVATTETDGLMSASDKKRFNNIGNVYALKSLYGDTTIDVGRKTGTDVGICSDAEGWHTTASGNYSHTEGLSTTASNRCSHAEGVSTVASGESSHAEGVGAVAFGDYSHARGYNTITNNTCETASGKYNVSNDNTLFSIGDGTADDARHNAFEITTTGGKLHDKDIATTDLIPTTLPANGGNADTVGGVGIANLRQITQTVINTLPAVPNGEGDFFVDRDEGDTSFPYKYGHLSIRYGSYTGEYVAIFRTTGNDNKIYYNTYLTDHWSGWINVADGGNADTVGGKSADEFMPYIGYVDDLGAVNQNCICSWSSNTLNTPFKAGKTNASAGICIVNSVNGSWPTYFVICTGAKQCFIHHQNQNNGKFVGNWKEISTTPIKSTTFDGAANGTGSFNLWAPSENKVPISIQLDNKPFYAVPFLYNNLMWIGSTIDATTRQPVTSTAVSGTVYYIEV